MERLHNTRYRFGPYTLDSAERRILDASSSPIELTTKAFDLLLLLVSRAGQLVTKDEILDVVWQEVSIAESNLTTTISMVRKALQEDPDHRFIETVPKKGYRFVVPVSIVSDPEDHDEGPGSPILPQHAANKKRLHRIGVVALITVFLGAGIAFVLFYLGYSNKNSSEVLFQNAVRHDAEGKDDLAIKELTEIQPSDPLFVKARIHLAWLLYQADKNDDAKRSLEPVLSGQSSATLKLLDESTRLKIDGIKQLLTDQPNSALNDFRAAADSDSKDIDALIYIADTAISLGNFPEADKALGECKAVARLNPFCGYERIDVLTHEGKYDEAIAEYTYLKDSKYLWLDQPAGYAELARGNADEALRHFKSLIANGPTGSRVHFLAAQDGIVAADLLKGELTTARQELLTAKNLTDSGYEKADYSILMAKIEALLGNFGQARIDLEEASNLSGSQAFESEIARIYAMIGDDAEAKNILARTQGTGAVPELEYGAAEPFVNGLESLKRKDFKKASEQLDTSFSMNQSPETAYFAAKAEMSLGDWNAAISHFSFILQNREKVLVDSVALLIPLSEYDLGVCYRSLGQESEANKHFAAFRGMWDHADPELKLMVR